MRLHSIIYFIIITMQAHMLYDYYHYNGKHWTVFGVSQFTHCVPITYLHLPYTSYSIRENNYSFASWSIDQR